MAGNVTGLHVFAADVGPEALSLLDGNFNPLTAALNLLNNFANYYVDSGAVNALVVSLGANQSVNLVDGLVLDVTVAATSTITAPTLNVAGLGAKPIVQSDGTALAPGAMIANGRYRFIYDGANFRVQNPTNLNVICTAAGDNAINAAGFGSDASAAGANRAVSGRGAPNAYTIEALGSATSSQSYGITIAAGTTNADIAFNVQSQTGGIVYIRVYGNGEAFVLEPPAASAAPTSGHQIGYLEIPDNIQAGSYSLVLTDRGKFIQFNAGTTLTIPANASVAFPIGTTIMVNNLIGANLAINITTDTLQWQPSLTNGNRTLGSGGIATLYKRAATTWAIWGFSIT